jgi:hypothetical protein
VNPLVVDMVLIGFRVFVPAIVPQTVAAVAGYRPAPAFVVASMVAGPAVALGVGVVAPSTTLTAMDPVLWGTGVRRRCARGYSPSRSKAGSEHPRNL